MAIDKVTAYTPVTSTNSNVRYQIRAFYKVTSRTATQVTVDLDFQVYFPQYWSSNGSWFKFRTATKSANPQHIRGYYNWYASTGNADRRDGASYWLTGQKFNVTPQTTSLTIQVGFSNYQWAIGDFHTQNLTLNIGEGYSAIGVPGAVRATSYLNTTKVTFAWAAAAAGFNNPVKQYNVVIERATNENFTSNVTVVKEEVTTQLKSTYTFSATDPNGAFYRARVSATDTATNTTTKSILSDIAKKQIPPLMPQLISPAANSVIKPGDKITVTPLAQLGGTAPKNLLLQYRVTSAESYYTGDYQNSNVFAPVFGWLIGHEPTIMWRIKDGLYESDWSTPVKFRTGSSISVAALDFNTTDLVGDTNLTIRASRVGTSLMNNITETLKLQWQDTNGVWEDLQAVQRSSKGAVVETIEIQGILGLIHSQYPNRLNSTRAVPFRVLASAGALTGTSAISTLTYKVPKTNIQLLTIDGSNAFKYSMNSPSPILENMINISIDLTDVSVGEYGTLSIELFNLKTNQTSTLYERSFSSNINEIKSFAPELFGSGEYKLMYVVRYTKPYPSIVEGTFNGITTLRVADKPNVDFIINNEEVRTNFITNTSSINEFNAGYSITWTEPRAYVITDAELIIEDNLFSHTLVYAGPDILLYDDVTKRKDFSTSLIRLSDIKAGDLFDITSYRILNEALVSPSETLELDENQVNIKITYKIYLKEVFRSSSSATEPDLTLLGDQEEKIEFSFIANTICKPEFTDRNLGVTFERVLS